MAVGQIVDFAYPTEASTAFAIRLGQPASNGVGPDRDIVAFLRACPHMGCPIVKINVDKGVLGPCGCHRSRFDLTDGGRQIVGHASQSLVQITLEVEDDRLFAVGLGGLPYGHAMEASR